MGLCNTMRKRLAPYGQARRKQLQVSAEFGVIALLLQVAAFTVQAPTDMPLPSFLANNPRPVDPGRPVANMLMVATVELGDPVALIISMKCKNFSLHDADLILPWDTPRPNVPVRAASGRSDSCGTHRVQQELGPQEIQSKA
jgi:hypothetical protein